MNKDKSKGTNTRTERYTDKVNRDGEQGRERKGMRERKVNRKEDRETEIPQKKNKNNGEIFQLRAGKHSGLQGDREGEKYPCC